LLRWRTVQRTRFYGLRWVALPILGVMLGLLAGLLVLMVAAASNAGGPPLVPVFAVLTLAFLGEAAWIASMTVRPIVLSRSALRIPNGFKTVVIPLDDVAGVGLLYHSFRRYTQSGSAWSVFVWRRNGSAQRAGILICRRGPDLPPSQLAASRAGRMATRLDAKIRARQGPAGSLATLELQKHASSGLAYHVVAFWSPDGDMGLVRY
jgi:hypothetical protein